MTTNNLLRSSLILKKLGIDTYKESVVYIHADSHICKAEGFEAQTRILVQVNSHKIIATLNTIHTDLLKKDQASLSNNAWETLGVKEGDEIILSHPKPLTSLSYVRSKIYGKTLSQKYIEAIVDDIFSGNYSDVNIAAFLTACAGGKLNEIEILHLTEAMIQTGDKLQWSNKMVVDKHCVGGLPGNRTSLIVVPIIAAYGLTIPKTSSRAITSPSGTADTMEVFAPVNIDIHQMKKIVERENGCIIWGGGVSLSPADDILIRVERALDLDSEGQMVASILSKKIAAGSSHIIIDIPIGPTAKVRTTEMANMLTQHLVNISQKMGIHLEVMLTDGSQPIGNGIGPCLEAKDVLAVLSCQSNAPLDLRKKSIELAARILVLAENQKLESARIICEKIIDSGQALKKFQSICEAQGGFSAPKCASHRHPVFAKHTGIVSRIDNRRLARIAKLAGAPRAPSAGIELHAHLQQKVNYHEPLFTIHAESKGELQYAIAYLEKEPSVFHIEGNPE